MPQETFTVILRCCEDGSVSVKSGAGELSDATVELLREALAFTEQKRRNAQRNTKSPIGDNESVMP